MTDINYPTEGQILDIIENDSYMEITEDDDAKAFTVTYEFEGNFFRTEYVECVVCEGCDMCDGFSEFRDFETKQVFPFSQMQVAYLTLAEIKERVSL